MATFGVRIICMDFYMAAPIQGLDVTYSEFRGSSISHVPIIRIFGTNDAGKKVCLHVHGVFPYFYVPYDGVDDANVLMYQLAANIDKAINISFGQTSSNAQHVYKISLVSGIPFYGYHTGEHQYFKIWLYNPILIRKVNNLLDNESILGKHYQPHEVHIPFTMQFMIDYNLHGMSKIILNDLKFRINTEDRTNCTIPENLLLPLSVAKNSCCELECDTLSENIVNHLELLEGKLCANPGIQTLWEDEKQRRRLKGDDSQIGPCLSLDNTNVPVTKSHEIFKMALLNRLTIIDNSDSEKSDLNLSVYPAETPHEASLLDASFVDSHTPTIEANNLNQTLDFNNTLDETVLDLFEALQELGEKEEEKDTDSILSQVIHEDDDDYFDLSLPLEVKTPDKKENVDLEMDDDLDKTLIPQLDGAFDHNEDSSSSDELNITIKSQPTRSEKSRKYKVLPISVTSRKTSGKKQVSAQKRDDNNIEIIKRKLEFSDTSIASTTFVEEKLDCEYKAKENLILTSKITDITDNALDDFISKQFTKAEMYDLEKNYIPKEGTSTKFSQNSIELKMSLVNNQDLSQNSLEYLPNIKEDSNHDKPAKNSDSETASISEYFPNNKHVVESLKVASQKSSQNSSDDLFTKESSENISRLSQTLSDFDCESQGDKQNCKELKMIVTPKMKPPTRNQLIQSMEQFNIPKLIHRNPFYSKVNDVTGNIEVGNKILKIPSRTTADLDDFKTIYDGLDTVRKLLLPSNVKWGSEIVKKLKLSYCSNLRCFLVPLQKAPTTSEVKQWCNNKNLKKESPKKNVEKLKIYLPSSPNKANESDLELSLTISPPIENNSGKRPSSPVLGKQSKKRKVESNNSGLSGVTLNNTYGFKMTPENYQNVKATHEYQYLTVLVIELHIQTRGTLKPDPNYDPIRAIFYSIFEDSPENSRNSGVIAVNSLSHKKKFLINEIDNVTYVENETELYNEFIKLVANINPDICTGYEIELLSWGYLIERGYVLNINLMPQLSRTKDRIKPSSEDDKSLRLTGRIILDFWRLLRHEIALQSYTFESMSYHILHRRVPNFTFKDLSFWWEHPSSIYRHRTIYYYLLRVEGIIKIMDQLDLIGRTSELARLFGIQFYEVFSRGSQFRVESMMLRLAKPLNYIPVSPSVQQRAHMKAPEFLPLILEPESKMYVDPVIVLDFQSLYPSMIIAYNYCFSTCLGRVQHLGKNTPFEFGATQYKIRRKLVRKLYDKDDLNFSPCGVAFVKQRVRDGILPRMLREILDTRLMVKNSMKENKDNDVLQKVLYNRQLGLKLIANVTYGYTAANFSGRMPAVEIADSVVSKGRETLQRAIALVENTPEWGAKVVYGDTDSLFVCTPGKNRLEAFEIGKKIADAVTNANPDPVKLKLEKVYQPCILQTKKRYVGYMYENPEQKDPIYEAKGIETVRRDGCPAVAKMLEKCLRILFGTQDVSLVKQYVVEQFFKIVSGKINLQDLTFAKEYRGASGYRPGACVPALELARKWSALDKRNEPRSKERVPYIIANGPPGLPLIRLVKSPHDFIQDSSLKPNAQYYITKVIIPPLNRCMQLIGADLNIWYNQMPRKYNQSIVSTSPGKKITISQYFVSINCICCNRQTQTGICELCQQKPQETMVTLMEKVRIWEKTNVNINLICNSCSGISCGTTSCQSLDCPIFYKRNQAARNLQQTTFIRDILNLPQYQF